MTVARSPMGQVAGVDLGAVSATIPRLDRYKPYAGPSGLTHTALRQLVASQRGAGEGLGALARRLRTSTQKLNRAYGLLPEELK